MSRRNVYALGAIGLFLVLGALRLITPVYAFFFIAGVVWLMSARRKRENRARFDEELRQWHARNPDPLRHWETPPPAPPPKSGWSMAGTVLAAITAVGGLAMLALIVLLFVALSTGNFKLYNK